MMTTPDRPTDDDARDTFVVLGGSFFPYDKEKERKRKKERKSTKKTHQLKKIIRVSKIRIVFASS